LLLALNDPPEVWSIPSQGGTPRKISAGNGVAVVPNGKDLIVSSIEQEHVRLMRVPLSGAPPQEIQVRGDIHVASTMIGPGAVNSSGQILTPAGSPNSWFFRPAMVDMATGEIKEIPLNYSCDIMNISWAKDGRILAVVSPIRANIWRFRPAP
jgi:hypothetical protein